MKRITAILLVLILAFTLIACSNTGTTTSPSASGSAAPASASASASASAQPSASPSASEKSTIGFVTDKVDHFNRKQYKFGTISLSNATTYTQMLNTAFKNWGKVLNYTTYDYDSNLNYDAYVNEIQVMSDQGYDGVVFGMDDAVLPRAYELSRELKMNCIGMPTAFADKDGHITWPSVVQDEYGNGGLCVQWLADNYKNYWKDPIDKSKLGIIAIDFSPVSGIHARVPGVKDAFMKLFPEASKNYYVDDLVTNPNGFSNQAANEMTAATITAHPEITKWFVVGCVDDWAVGATRAVEALNKTDSVLVVSDQADAFVSQLDGGYTGNVYVAANAVSTTDLAGYCGAYLVTIKEGRATPETIWPDYLKAGEKYPCIVVKGTMLTKDTYKDWLKKTSFETVSAGMKQGS